MADTFDVVKAKTKVAGYTTSLNAKITGASKLAEQTISPPVLRSDLVTQQLNKRLTEVTESWEKLSSLLDQIIKYYKDNPEEGKKTTGYHHYVNYQSKKLCEYYECRNLLTLQSRYMEIEQDN